ncbi:hypothetical protein GW17_00041218 [Ensete ventricosum]|nr:hypothetical protein GW17_00041218 [Ensete ventricosum]
MTGEMKLQPYDGPRSSLSIGPEFGQCSEISLEFARRFAERIGKLVGNTLGDYRKKTERLTARMPKAIGFGGTTSGWRATRVAADVVVGREEWLEAAIEEESKVGACLKVVATARAATTREKAVVRYRGGWLWLRGKMAAVRRGWTTAEGREEQRWLTEEEAAKGEGSDDVWLLRQERRKGRLQQWQQWETPP